MSSSVNRTLFFVLLGLSILSVVCVFPYVLTLQRDVLTKIGQPIPLIFVAQLVQSAILFSVTIYLGLLFTRTTGLRLPLLEAWLKNENYQKIAQRITASSFLLGVVIAITIYVLDGVFSSFGVGITTHQNYAPVWQKLLAAVYGGITEEILMRLFLMNFFIWIGMKLFRQTKPTGMGIMIPLILAAIIFGLGHLPITASLTAITPLVVARAVVLNGIGGIVFGWLFWKKGFESAVIAHFTTDIVLLTLLPLLFA